MTAQCRNSDERVVTSDVVTVQVSDMTPEVTNADCTDNGSVQAHGDLSKRALSGSSLSVNAIINFSPSLALSRGLMLILFHFHVIDECALVH